MSHQVPYFALFRFFLVFSSKLFFLLQTVIFRLFFDFFSSFSSPSRIRTEFILVIFHLSQKVSQKWSKNGQKMSFEGYCLDMPFWALFGTSFSSVVLFSVRIQGGRVFYDFFRPKKVFTFFEIFIFKLLF